MDAQRGNDDVAARAKRPVIDAIAARLREGRLTKAELARRMRTSRSAVNRLLDPSRETSLPSLVAAAQSIDLCVRVVVEAAPARPPRPMGAPAVSREART